ncbi:MAG: hypothetical protein IPG89_14365 [Bacteroidetes bacterium]|nr:hypothetical protein [Bacteroidota bacterium]
MKYTNKIFTSLITPFLMFIYSCKPDVDDDLIIINKSPYSISISKSVPWADSIVNSIHINLRDVIKPNQSDKIPNDMSKIASWRLDIRSSKDKTLKIWVFNQDTLIKYKDKLSINQIVQKKLMDTLLIYNEKQIDSMKFKIVYLGKQNIQH